MYLYKLKPLKSSMIKDDIKAVTFNYKHNNTTFAIIFYNLSQMLLTFVKTSTKEHFTLVIEDDFSINGKLDEEDYKTLVNMLGLKFEKGNPFSPSNFLFEFSQKIPKYEAVIKSEIKTCAKYISKHIDDADKTVFVKFISHANDGKHVSVENLNKTALYLGAEEAKRCKEGNVSSCWKIK